MGLDSLQNGATGLITANSNAIIAGAAGLAVGGVLGATAVAVSRRKKTKKRSKSSKRTRNSKKSRKSNYKRKKHKRVSRGSRKIRYTKNNQPYIILRNGRARFISKRSAKQSKRRKGGYY